VLGPDALFAGGVLGACVVTLFTFLPSFLFILAGGPLVESTRGRAGWTAPLAAITAAVVGVIASLGLFFVTLVARGDALGPAGPLGFDWPALGLAALPALDTLDLRSEAARRGVRVATPEALRALDAAQRRRSVVVVQDAFTTHYDAALVLDLCELLQRLGFQPWLSPYRANGKPQHVLGMLDAFEATARLRSMVAAAEELSVTHGAISRHVRGLEETLGVQLLTRGPQSTDPTPEGQRLAEGVAAAINLIQSTLEQVRPGPLTLSCSASILTHWLLPRLARFHRAHPGVELQFNVNYGPVDVVRENIGVAIRNTMIASKTQGRY